MKTTKDLMSYCRARKLDYRDYGCPVAFRQDQNERRRARELAKKEAGWRWRVNEPLVPGEYYNGRLIITHDSIRYIPGQYAPTEINYALADYYKQIRK